jgi:small-conductance mechanosensitive channel
MTLLSLLLAISALLPFGTALRQPAQGSSPEPKQELLNLEGVVSREDRSLATLEALHDSRKVKVDQLEQLRAEFDRETSSELRLQQLDQVKAIQAEIDGLDHDFSSIATGIDQRLLDSPKESETDLTGELTQFLQPLMTELREATESPREIERLTDLLETIEEQRIPSVEAGLQNIRELIAACEGVERTDSLKAQLEKNLTTWQLRLDELENQRQVVAFQLEERVRERGSVLQSTSTLFGSFFRNRGLNLLLAFGAFVMILVLLRLVHHLVRGLLRIRPREERPFYARLIDVTYFVMGSMAAVLGGLLVLYAAGDWALLVFATLVLMGLAWASKTAFPLFIDHIRIMLNLGAVRELERVEMDGLPWRVARITLHALLVNPELSGGRRHIPLRDLHDLRSRKANPDERWFPTRAEDWVLLADGRLARVELQTPETVYLRLLGGSELHIPTAEFLTSGVENLSDGFRINSTFGIDYDHQAIATTEVCEVMQGDLRAGLAALVPTEQLTGLRVEFSTAGPSSLDLAVLADFDGEAAHVYDVLQRGIQRILVETCTREGWVIPFTQLTIHEVASA